jgi:hypothetical protein
MGYIGLMRLKSLTDRFVGSVHTVSRANYSDTKARGLALRSIRPIPD